MAGGQFIDVTPVDRGPSSGERWGAALGTGLGSLLSGLAQGKAAQLQQRQFSKSLESAGVNPQIADLVSQLSPDLQKSALENLGSFMPMQQQQGQIGQEPQFGEQGSFPVQQSSDFIGQQQVQGQPSMNNEQVSNLFMPREERLTKIKTAQKEKEARWKESKPQREAIVEAARGARNNLHDLDRMEELQKEGKLDTPGYTEFLKRSGLDIPALMEPGSEEFQKIAQNFLRGAKEYYGGRVSNFEVEQFLKTVPSLSQSPEGRNRVIANLKRFNRAALETNEARKEVIKANGGIPPYDFSEQVDERLEKKLDKIAKQFRDDLNKPVPKGQNKLITALQAGAGNVIGKVPHALKGAALGAGTGAAIGAAGGPIGATGGAILGGLGGLGGLI